MGPKKNLLFSLVITLITLAGCRHSVVLPQPTATSSPTISPPISTIVPPTPTSKYPLPPIPTISPGTQRKIVALLNMKNCKLPCYMGITPGVTAWNNAKMQLDASGAVYQGPGKNDGLVTSYGYAMYSGSINSANKSSDSLFDLLLWVDSNGIVQKMFANFLTNDVGHILSEYWIKNSPKNVFSQIGIPDAIYSPISGGDLALVYQNRGVVGIYDSFWIQNFLCPGSETHLSRMRFMLTNTASPLDLYSPEQDVTQLPSLWVPIEQRMNVSAKQFYDKVLSDSSACFELKP